MAIPQKIYLKLRPIILPINQIVGLIYENAMILDLGCGKGILTKYIKNFQQYTGVDIVIPSLINDHKIKFVKSDCLLFIKNDLSKFNTFLLIDLLHHIPKKNQENFVNNLISKMKKGDQLIIKDIYPKNLITKFWNAFHDLFFSQQIIRYFDFFKFEKNLNPDIELVSHFHQRIFLYDHYFLVLKKI